MSSTARLARASFCASRARSTNLAEGAGRVDGTKADFDPVRVKAA